ncbi:MAG: porin family protein [FCB group bacterium]|nr:porin family protein [FCB group bacterium]
MKKACVLLVISILILSSAALGFDGNRKGFVLGGGLGFSPASNWKTELVPDLELEFEETKAGIGVNLLLGYAFDEYNMLVVEGNVAGYETGFDDLTATQGFGGVAWYHYFGAKGATFFTTVGMGSYNFELKLKKDNIEVSGSNDPGFGMLFGVGYEFSRHFQAGAYFSFGKTEAGPVEFDHAHINLLVSVVAY